MKAKRILSALLTAVILVTSFVCGAIPANAAESKLKLLTVPVTDISKEGTLLSLGKGIYVTESEFIRIGEAEIASWRKTGKLKPTKIKSDFKIPEYFTYSAYLDKGDYFYIASKDKDGNRTATTVLKYNETNKKISTVRTYKDAEWRYVTPDGYVVNRVDKNEKKETVTVKVDTPDGKSISNTFKSCLFKNNGTSFVACDVYAVSNNKYLYFATVASEPKYDSGSGLYIYNWTVYGVDKNGKKKAVNKYSSAYTSISCSDDVLFTSGTGETSAGDYCIYILSKDKKIIIDEDTASGWFGTFGLVQKIGEGDNAVFGATYLYKVTDYYNNKVVATYYNSDSCVLDFSKGTPSFVGAPYKYISTNDGKIYIIKNFEDKWGYMNNKGKELRLFDDAGSFKGDYAPVVKNGKAYLIDKKMKTVSKKFVKNHLFRIAPRL